MSTLRYKIEVMLAYEDSSDIESRNDKEWSEAPTPDWNWEDRDYRVKPQRTKMYAYMNGAQLVWYASPSMGYKRVPAEDKTIEVEA